MINNDNLFDHFRSARRYGYRSGWTRPSRSVNPAVQQVVSVFVEHGLPEPAETISETDVFDPDTVMDECGTCGESDWAAMHPNGHCVACNAAYEQDWQDTMRAVLREEYAMRGGPLVV